MPILELYKVSSDSSSSNGIVTQLYYFLVNSKTYLNIETVSGIKKVINADEMNAPITKVDELLRAGVLLRMTASGVTAAKVRRSYHLLVLRSRAGVVQANLIDKIIQGTKITSVVSRRKTSFY